MSLSEQIAEAEAVENPPDYEKDSILLDFSAELEHEFSWPGGRQMVAATGSPGNDVTFALRPPGESEWLELGTVTSGNLTILEACRWLCKATAADNNLRAVIGHIPLTRYAR